MTTVTLQLDDVGTMLRRRGLETGGRVQKLFTNEVARQADPYVPMQTGTTKNSRIIQDDCIIYPGPHSRFLYHGKVMIGVFSHSPWARLGERKVVTDRDLTYHGAPRRGPFWDKRMWADKKTAIVDKIAAAAGGKPG